MSPIAKPTFKWVIELPKTIDRDEIIGWIWNEFGSRGLLGIHEGTILTDQAVAHGFETEPWIFDQGLAPENRDWVSELSTAQVEIHSDTKDHAVFIRSSILQIHPDLFQSEIEELEALDWDAEWKKNFQGIELAPNWWVIPPWRADEPEVKKTKRRLLLVNPGAGFGTGTHPTTQLCLETLTHHWDEIESHAQVKPLKVLDFGSGSGILSIAAALLGGIVLGCEIDELANDNARENSKLNGVSDLVQFQVEFPQKNAKFDLIIANILKPILIEYCDELISRLNKGATVVLSGLIEPDLKAIIPLYQTKLGIEYQYQIHERDEWRSVYCWRKA
ncbi:MAG: 50S ribosomal protein L11 methyltransferase [Xanthomonadaceae bacterium]|nr:50S ribosomal protein L11 methyltransferase [Xanthomonadaceae bacterium]